MATHARPEQGVSLWTVAWSLVVSALLACSVSAQAADAETTCQLLITGNGPSVQLNCTGAPLSVYVANTSATSMSGVVARTQKCVGVLTAALAVCEGSVRFTSFKVLSVGARRALVADIDRSLVEFGGNARVWIDGDCKVEVVHGPRVLRVSGNSSVYVRGCDVSQVSSQYELDVLSAVSEEPMDRLCSQGVCEGAATLVTGTATLTVEDSTFAHNHAFQGSSVYVGAAAAAAVRRCHFTGNGAGVSGGAVHALGRLQVHNCTFTGNAVPGRGGGLYARGSPVELVNSTFMANVATVTMGTGGGAFLEASDALVLGCVFSGHTCPGNGSALSVIGGRVVMRDSEFFSNNAGFMAGALMLNGSATFEMHGCRVAHNRGEASHGGAIAACSGSLGLVFGSVIYNNSGSFAGGAMIVLDGSAVTFLNTSFLNNTCFASHAMGGALVVQNYSNATVLDSEFMFNNCSNGAGAISVTNGYVTVRRTLFFNNTTPYHGGAVSGWHNPEVPWPPRTTSLYESCNFTKNWSDGGSGGAACVGELITSTFINCTFENNYARTSGGGLTTFRRGMSFVHNSTFKRNKTPGHGGALLSEGIETVVRVNDSSLMHNRAGTMGGGINVQHFGTLVADRLRIENNTAGSDGGAVSAYNGTVILSSSTIINNTATVDGGALFSERQGTVWARECLFWNNSAGIVTSVGRGGTVFIDEGSLLYLADSTVVDSRAGLRGGALMVNNATANITGTTILNSRTTGSGGAALVVNGSLACWRCDFSNNTAGDNGGALMASENATLALMATRVAQNSALRGFAGGLVVDQDSSVVAIDCEFVGNQAPMFGGAVYAANSSVNFTSTTFADNVASIRGGGLDLFGSSLWADNCVLTGNRATMGSGGGVHSDSCNATLVSLVATANEASFGGGLYLWSSNTSVYNSSVSRNVGRGGGVYYTGEGSTLLLSADTRIVDSDPASPCAAVFVDSTDGLSGPLSVVAGSFSKYMVDWCLPVHNLTTTLHVSRSHGQLVCLDAAHRAGVEVLPLEEFTRTNAALSCSSKADLNSDTLGLLVSALAGIPGHYKPLPDVQLTAFCAECVRVAATEGFIMNPVGVTNASGMADMRSMKLRAAPGLYTVLVDATFMSDGVGQIALPVDVRPCRVGEYKPYNMTCEPCPPQQFGTDTKSCSACPFNAQCHGGSLLVPNENNWHSSAASDQIHACINPFACTGSRSAIQACQLSSSEQNTTCQYEQAMQCSAGYTGNLCGSCASVPAQDGGPPVRYGWSGAFKCVQCWPLWATMLAKLGAALLSALFIALMVGATIEDNQRPQWSVRAADLIKLVVFHCQILLLMAWLPIQWPEFLTSTFTAIKTALAAGSDQNLSVDCLWAPENENVALYRSLWTLFMPFITLVCVLVFRLCLVRVQHRRTWRGWRASQAMLVDQLLVTCMVTAFFCFPWLSRLGMSMFSCYRLDAPRLGAEAVGWFWVLDMRLQCWEGQQLSWALGLGLPVVLVVCMGLPVATGLFLSAHRADLHSQRFRKRFGFLYRNYRDGMFFWEAVQMGSLVVVVAVCVFGLSLGPFYQVLLLAFVLMAMSTTVSWARPMEHTVMYNAKLASLTTLTTSALLAAGFFGSNAQNSMTNDALAAMILVVNACMLLALIVVVLMHLRITRRQAGVQQGKPPGRLAAALACLCCDNWTPVMRRGDRADPNAVAGAGLVARHRSRSSTAPPRETLDPAPAVRSRSSHSLSHLEARHAYMPGYPSEYTHHATDTAVSILPVRNGGATPELSGTEEAASAGERQAPHDSVFSEGYTEPKKAANGIQVAEPMKVWEVPNGDQDVARRSPSETLFCVQDTARSPPSEALYGVQDMVRRPPSEMLYREKGTACRMPSETLHCVLGSTPPQAPYGAQGGESTDACGLRTDAAPRTARDQAGPAGRWGATWTQLAAQMAQVAETIKTKGDRRGPA